MGFLRFRSASCAFYLLLLLKQLSLSGDIATITLGGHILAHCRDTLASNNFTAMAA